MKKFILPLGLALALLTSCDINKKESGELPEVDVDVETEAGELPEYDVDWADVDISTRTETVEVPKVVVVMEEEEVEVLTAAGAGTTGAAVAVDEPKNFDSNFDSSSASSSLSSASAPSAFSESTASRTGAAVRLKESTAAERNPDCPGFATKVFSRLVSSNNIFARSSFFFHRFFANLL